MSANDGGPAFPQINQWDPDKYTMGPSGMTLRDYFAAKAMQGLMANPERYRYIREQIVHGPLTNETASEKNAHKAYLIADAMLKERTK